MSKNLQWDDAQTLLAVLRAGSLLGAARALGLTQPTVRRRIEALEAALGASLFTRGSAAVAPTQTALGMRAQLEAMERAALALQRHASADASDLEGRVRIATTETLGVEAMPQLLAPLRKRHGALQIELVLSDRMHDLVAQECDIAMRTVRPASDCVVVQRLGAVRVGLYASPALLARRGVPPTLERLGQWPLVTPDRSAMDWDKLAQHGYPVGGVRDALRTDYRLAQLAAVRAGLGIGPCHQWIAERAGLVPVLPDAFGFELELWLAMPESHRTVRRVATVFRHLARHVPRLLGSLSA